MRILMVIPQKFYSTRGTPLSAYHRARELTRMGHAVDIVTYGPGDDPPGLDAKVYRSAGPHFASDIAPGPSRLKIWFDTLLLANLLWRLLRTRYDLVYAHEEGAFLARLARGITGVPYIYDMHSSLPLQITEWKFSASSTVLALFRWVERVAIAGARAVVAISPAVEKAARSAVPSANVVTIVNHFELGRATSAADAAQVRERYGIPQDAPLAIYTGSFVELQALPMLIEAVPLVVRRIPDVRFLLVGGTPEEIAPLARQAEQLAVSDRVVFDIARPQSEMPATMAAATVLLSPRIRGINPPGKLLPYLASGRPVVATDTLVHNQLLDGSCAFLTRPDAQGFADGVVAALTETERSKAVVAGASSFLRQYCSDQARRAAYSRLFRMIGPSSRAALPAA
jgi:glycosyltransferase involved in cell wall biosynthesis